MRLAAGASGWGLAPPQFTPNVHLRSNFRLAEERRPILRCLARGLEQDLPFRGAQRRERAFAGPEETTVTTTRHMIGD